MVGRHAVGEHHQGRDGGFGAALAANVAREARNEEVDATVVANHFHQSPGQEGDEDGFVHARHAFGHRREPSGHIKGAGGQTDGAREDIAQQQHQHHVDTEHRGHQHGEIRHDFQETEIGNRGHIVAAVAQHAVECKANHRGGQCDADVGAELVAESHALRAGGHDGGVGNERKIVAEKCTAHHGTDHQGEGETGRRGHTCGNGHQGHDCAHARADAQRDKTGSHEQSRQKQRDGKRTQRHGDRRIDGTHLFGRGRKRAGEDENPKHHHQIFLARTATEHTHAFGDGK